MPIKYKIRPNSLQEGSYYASVVHGQRVGVAQMIPNIVGKTTLSAADVQAVITALNEEIIAILLAGNTAVLDDIVALNVSLKGSLEAADASVNIRSTELQFKARVSKKIQREVTQNASFARVAAPIKQPTINNIIDVTSDNANQYTAGSILRLRGSNLRFDKNDGDQGVFVQNGGDPVRLSVYSRATDSQVEALIPADVSGPLTVTVKTRYSANGELRSGSYQRQLVDSQWAA